MPRTARVQSASGNYHVMLRGVGRRIIFEDDADRRAFLGVLARCAKECEVDLIAYCLMSNHVHLALDNREGVPSRLMRRIGTSYAMRFNRLNDHVGHVFQGRFKSVPVESNEQLLETVRYVHRNPAEAEIGQVDTYAWSSYGEYVGRPQICKTDGVLDLLDGVDGFVEYMRGRNGDFDPFPEARALLLDDKALAIAREVLGEQGMRELEGDSRSARNRCLRILRDKGMSARQVSRITGIGRSIVTAAFRG